jgi:hypothetical protein
MPEERLRTVIPYTKAMDVVRYLLGKYMGTYRKNHYDMDKHVEKSHRNNYYNMEKHTGQ